MWSSVPLLKSGPKNFKKCPIFTRNRQVAPVASNIDAGFGFELRDNAAMARIWFGTSGFSYKEWRPIFYPAGLSDRQFLSVFLYYRFISSRTRLSSSSLAPASPSLPSEVSRR